MLSALVVELVLSAGFLLVITAQPTNTLLLVLRRSLLVWLNPDSLNQYSGD